MLGRLLRLVSRSCGLVRAVDRALPRSAPPGQHRSPRGRTRSRSGSVSGGWTTGDYRTDVSLSIRYMRWVMTGVVTQLLLRGNPLSQLSTIYESIACSTMPRGEEILVLVVTSQKRTSDISLGDYLGISPDDYHGSRALGHWQARCKPSPLVMRLPFVLSTGSRVA